MIVFKNEYNYKPQTFLNKLKNFAETKYSTSEIYSSYPTVVLELSHIKFGLVPAYISYGTYYIPSPSNYLSDWISTYPQQIKDNLLEKNKNYSYNIKPLVRLIKYWNVKKVNKGYTSFNLEEWIINSYFYGCSNIKDFVIRSFENFKYNINDPQYIKI
jgi:hypothetical protein